MVSCPYRSVLFISPALQLGRPGCLLLSHQRLLTGHLWDSNPYFVFCFFSDTLLPGSDTQRKSCGLGAEYCQAWGRPWVLFLELQKRARVQGLECVCWGDRKMKSETRRIAQWPRAPADKPDCQNYMVESEN